MNTVAKNTQTPIRHYASRILWTAAMDQLLGKHTDQELAVRFGTTRSVVAYRRNLLGIEPFAMPVEKDCSALFTPDVVARFPSMTTEKIAAELGISTAQVIKFRKQHGLSLKPRRGRRPAELDSLLGTMPDTELADLYGLSSTTIGRDRARLGIAPYEKPIDAPQALDQALERELIDALGTAHDKDLAAKYGKARLEVSRMRRERGIARYIDRFEATPEVMSVISSKRSIAGMASALGVSVGQVTNLRRKLGLSNKAMVRRKPKIIWNIEHDALLGKEPDTTLCSRLGYTPHQVMHRRQALGIPRYIKPADDGQSTSSPGLADLIGQSRDWVVAKKLDLPLSAVREARIAAGVAPHPDDAWITDELIAQLKVKSPTELGLELGIEKNRLRLLAKALGIQVVGLQSVWTGENQALLGTMPDTEIAESLSINLSRVTGKRNKLGIAAFDRFKKATTNAEPQ